MIWEYEIAPVCDRIEDIRNRKETLVMKKEVLDYVAEKTHEMMEAHSCSAEAKAAGQAWLDAVGTENEAQETEKYIAELEADIMPIDNLIAFAESEGGAQVFGAEKTKEGREDEGSSGPCERDQGSRREILRLPGMRSCGSDPCEESRDAGSIENAVTVYTFRWRNGRSSGRII